MKQFTHILIALMAVAVLGGCATKKQVAGNTGSTEKTIAKKPKQTLQEKTILAQPEFTSVYAQKAKFSINYQQRQISANGTISLITDSIFIVSVQPLLGIELLRLEATPNEVVVVDKMNRRYVQMNYAELQKQIGMPVTYNDLQALVTDRLFLLGQPQQALVEKTIPVTTTGTTSILTFTQDRLNYLFSIDETNYALTATELSVGKEKVRVNYEGHTLNNNVFFPTKITLSYSGGKMEASGVITLPNLTFNGSVNATRMSLKSYKKTDLNTILTGK